MRQIYGRYEASYGGNSGRRGLEENISRKEYCLHPYTIPVSDLLPLSVQLKVKSERWVVRVDTSQGKSILPSTRYLRYGRQI